MSRGRRLPARLLPWVAVLLAVLVAVLGLGVARSGHRTATQVVDTVRGGTAVIDVASVPTNLNPHTLAGSTVETQAVGDLIWPQCYEIGPGLKPQLDTELLASAEVVSVVPETVVYHIDPAARWSNGVPIRASAFEYLWHEESGAARPLPGGVHRVGSAISLASTLGYRDIASVTGSKDGTEVTVVFRTPYADWPDLFDNLLPPGPSAASRWSHGFGRLDQISEVSGGPWAVSSWQPGVRLVLVHNPKWWGPAPRLGRIVLQAVPDTAAMVGSLLGGRAQVVQPAGFDLGTLDAVSSSALVRSSSSLGTTMLQLVFNTEQGLVATPAVRQAVGHLVDRTKLVTDLVQPLEPLAWVDDSYLYPNVQAGYRDNGQAYLGVDPTKAMSLLAAAGIVPGRDGALESDGIPVTLTLVWAAGDPWSALAGPVIAAQLQAAGFSVDSRPLPGSSLRGRLHPGGAWDLAIAPVHAQAYTSLLAPEYSTAFGTTGVDGIRDLSGFNSPAIDALFTQASRQLFAVAAAGIYQQIDQDLWAAMPALPLFAEPTMLAWSSSLAGVEGDAGGAGVLYDAQHLALVRRPVGSDTLAAPATTREPPREVNARKKTAASLTR